MSKNINVVNLNDNPEIIDTVDDGQDDPGPTTETPETEVPGDIDTDELEGMLKDLKQIKKQNKAPAKKRIRKPKTVAPVESEPEPEPVVVAEPVVEPEVEVATPKPKRKYIRKVLEVPEKAPEPETPRHVAEEPVKRTAGVMIEEMQRAERALRYQMRKNKMQTLVSQAF